MNAASGRVLVIAQHTCRAKTGGSRAAARHTLSTFTWKVGEAQYPGRVSNGVSSSNARNWLTLDTSCDSLRLCDPKDIALSVISPSTLLTMLRPLRVGGFFVLAVALSSRVHPVFCLLGDGKRSSALSLAPSFPVSQHYFSADCWHLSIVWSAACALLP